MMIGIIDFTTDVSLGNILTISLLLLGGLKAWFSLGERSRVNASKIEEITRRIDDADLARLKVCVDTMWLFQLRRGVAEVEEKRLGKVNSPVQLTQKANDLMRPLYPELKSFYEAIKGEELGLVELAIELERQFGERITSDVCRKVGITDAACLVLAIGQLRPIGPEELRLALDACPDHDDLKIVAKKLL